jgi:uncharacterized membrane protein
MTTKHVTGPIQVIVVGFDKFQPTGQILAELRRVRKRGVIRVIDVLFVEKDDDGVIKHMLHGTDLSEKERMRLGAVAGGLLGLGAGGARGAVEGAEAGATAVAERDSGLTLDRLAELADSIPAGTAAGVLVVEHHWAARLRDAVREAGGRPLMQAMITPEAVALVGEELRVTIEAEEAIELAEAVKVAAAMDIARTLAEAHLIEDIALTEAAEMVAMALAIEDAVAADVADTLLVAGLIKEAAVQDAERVVAMTIDVEESAIEEAEDVVVAAEIIKRQAAIEAVRALIAAELIEEGAAEEAAEALVTADLVEREGERLADGKAIVDSILANDVIVGVHRLSTDRYDVEIEYPARTINGNERDIVYQTDTGPILWPDLARDPDDLLPGLELAFTAANAPDWAQIIVRRRTSIADGVEVYHYADSIRVEGIANEFYRLPDTAAATRRRVDLLANA